MTTIKSLTPEQRAKKLLRAVETFRKKYPESKEWTQVAFETLNYVVYGCRCYWLNEYFGDVVN